MSFPLVAQRHAVTLAVISPLWFIFRGITTLIGFSVGLAMGISIVISLAPLVPKHRRKRRYVR